MPSNTTWITQIPTYVHDNCEPSAWPWGGAWQSADHVSTSPRCMSINKQLSPTTLLCRWNAISRSKENSSPGICFFTTWLLQLNVVWRYRQHGSTSSSCPNCCCMPCYWRLPVRAYHTGIETTPLAASAEYGRPSLQVVERLVTAVPDGWLLTYHSHCLSDNDLSVLQCCYVWRS